jgi:hypothetical protein
MRLRLPGSRWLAALLMAALASAATAQTAAAPGLFDQLFGNDPAAERAGAAVDGLALPGLFIAGRRIADALPLNDLGPARGGCLAIVPLLDALELAHDVRKNGDIAVTLPDPTRTISIASATIIAGPTGGCVPLAALPGLLPITLTHDPVSQQLLLEAQAPLPVMMRLARAERQARLQAEPPAPVFQVQPRPSAIARLWSADLTAGLTATAGSTDLATNIIASGELAGLGARASLGLASRGAASFGFTLAESRDTPDLLGPLGARSIAVGDISAPAQPLIADALAGRGLVIASRPGWRADLVDEIDLSGPLATGWEAELWHEDRLVAATRTPDAAGNWRFARVPLRLGENRWRVRLFGPHGETAEQDFTRLVGTEMNAENEIDYTIGFVDGGTPLLGTANARVPSGAAAFATAGIGLAPNLTARLDLRAPLTGNPALALGLHGAHAETLWAATLARDEAGGLAGAVRVARRLGAQDFVMDWAHHGRATGPALPAPMREFSRFASISGQGRLPLGRFSLPWQLRLSTATRRTGGDQQAIAGRLALPLSGWQANAALALTRQNDQWQGIAALGASAGRDRWRLRGGVDALYAGAGWRMAGATLSAARTTGNGAISADLGWQATTGKFGGGISLNQRLGAFGLSAGVTRSGDGWRVGLGLVVGLWQSGGRWQAAPAGLARGGAVLADMFVDDDGDGAHDPNERPIAGGRFLVASTVRSETTGADGRALLRGLAPGPMVDVETQLASLPDLALRPARAGDRLALRPGEIRYLAIPVQPTGSIEARVLLVVGDTQSPLSNLPVVVTDAEGHERARTVTDFDGYALFEGLPFGAYTVRAADRGATRMTLSNDKPDIRFNIALPPAGA